MAKSGEKAGLVAAYSRIVAYCPNGVAIAFPVMPIRRVRAHAHGFGKTFKDRPMLFCPGAFRSDVT